jgi:hypothetical protein
MRSKKSSAAFRLRGDVVVFILLLLFAAVIDALMELAVLLPPAEIVEAVRDRSILPFPVADAIVSCWESLSHVD